jgi:hypothetical protein
MGCVQNPFLSFFLSLETLQMDKKKKATAAEQKTPQMQHQIDDDDDKS